MKKQTFRSNSMAEAVEVVRKEMGTDAIIISVRQVPLGPVWKVWQSPGVEVIAVAKGGQNKAARQDSSPGKKDADPAPALTPQAAADTSEKEPEPAPPVKNLAAADKKAVNMQAFQAALRRSGAAQPAEEAQGKAAATQQTQAQPAAPQKTVQSQAALEQTSVISLAQALQEAAPSAPKEDEGASQKSAAQMEAEQAAAKNAAKLISQLLAGDAQKATAQKSSAGTKKPAAADVPLNLNSPKPKLAIEELAAALTSPRKTETGAREKQKQPISLPAVPPAPKYATTGNGTETKPPTQEETARLPDVAEPGAGEGKDLAAQKPSHAEAKPGAAVRPKPRLRAHIPQRVVEEASLAKPTFAMPQTLAIARAQLLSQGVDVQLADKVARACVDTLSPQTLASPSAVEEYLQRQMEGHLRSRSAAQLGAPRLVCVIGPSGAGKTSLTAKLAAQALQRGGQAVVWISADTVRTGAIAEARVFADLLGIHLHLVYTPEELAQVVDEEGKQAQIFVDTPACNPYSEASLVEMGALLHSLPRRTTYLTIPATAKDKDLAQIQAAYGIFKMDGLVITKMDETRSLGSAFNLAWRSQLPLAYFTSGARLLEDLHPADVRTFTAALFAKQ